MRVSKILAVLLLGCAATARAELPADWLGSWRGDCTLESTGQPDRKFGMGLDVAPEDQGGGYTWKTTYEVQGSEPQVRDYRLLPGNAPGHFVVDEQNGIKIDSYLMGGTIMLELFYVSSGQNLLNARWEVAGDLMTVEIPTFRSRPGRTTTGPGGVQVTAFSMTGAQRCVLQRR